MALAQPRLRPRGLRAVDAARTPWAAVLWDMDGTLVDTEPSWIEAETALVESYGGTWTDEHAMNLVGRALLDSGAYLRDHGPVPLEPAEIVERLLDGVVARVQKSVPWRPGAVELLLALHEAGVPCALVTMSYTRFVEPILAQLPAGVFSVVVTGDEVTHGKPHPEPYLTAARLLGVEATDCLAIEDSAPGTTSAAAAGCTVLVVPHHVPVPTGPGRVFAATLRGMAPGDLPARQPSAPAAT